MQESFHEEMDIKEEPAWGFELQVQQEPENPPSNGTQESLVEKMEIKEEPSWDLASSNSTKSDDHKGIEIPKTGEGRRRRNRDLARLQRSMETEEEKEARRKKARNLSRLKRQQESVEEKEARRAKNRERQRLRRSEIRVRQENHQVEVKEENSGPQAEESDSEASERIATVSSVCYFCLKDLEEEDSMSLRSLDQLALQPHFSIFSHKSVPESACLSCWKQVSSALETLKMVSRQNEFWETNAEETEDPPPDDESLLK